jgi:hypothetical protein
LPINSLKKGKKGNLIERGIAMLEYTKTVLVRVSFDKLLFKKELEKSLNTLEPKEILQLQTWLGQKYSRVFPEIIEEYF